MENFIEIDSTQLVQINGGQDGRPGGNGYSGPGAFTGAEAEAFFDGFICGLLGIC